MSIQGLDSACREYDHEPTVIASDNLIHTFSDLVH